MIQSSMGLGSSKIRSVRVPREILEEEGTVPSKVSGKIYYGEI